MIEVSVIIVTRNEERYIVDCIQSVEKQFNDDTNWELIVVDGLSKDETVELTESYLANAKYQHTIIDNPKKILASGWNLGINNASGKFIVRPDAHAILYPNYISFGLQTLHEKTEVGVVGGTLITLSKNFWGSIIKEALSSKVGVGNSSFRIGAKSGYKDTAVYGIYRKDVFNEVGLFDENLIRHQDTELHGRISETNWKFWLNNELKAGYYCRDTIGSLAKQMYHIGLHIPDLVHVGKNQGVQIRHLIPFIFFASSFAGLLLGVFLNIFFYLAFIQIGFYFLVLILFSIYKVINTGKLKFKYLLLAPTIVVIHFNYFAGTLMGFLKKIFSRKK